MRDIALIVQVRHGGGNGVVVEFLAVVDFMATGNAAGMKVADPLMLSRIVRITSPSMICM